MVCARCKTRIQPRQLYIPRPEFGRLEDWPQHVACPSPERIAHCRRMGRPL
jgi:recombinational DNA repair protein (RecF pathway)